MWQVPAPSPFGGQKTPSILTPAPAVFQRTKDFFFFFFFITFLLCEQHLHLHHHHLLLLLLLLLSAVLLPELRT